MVENLLSIIIAVYNTEPYLEQCLNSVINQTYKNMEIICINDGSTDNSLKILKKYQAKDNRIKIISQENKGLSEAWNVGLKIAKGKYIGFVDSDDFINLDMYEKLMKPMLEDPSIDFSVSGFLSVSENGLQIQGQKRVYLSGKHRAFLSPKLIFPTTWGKVYKKSIIQEQEIDFPKGLYSQDNNFTNLYMINSKYAYYIDDYLYNYRQRKSSTWGVGMQIEHIHRRIDRIRVDLYTYNYLKKKCLLKRYKKFLYTRIKKQIATTLTQAASKKDGTLRHEWVLLKLKWELTKEIFKICKQYDFTFSEKLSFWISLFGNLF